MGSTSGAVLAALRGERVLFYAGAMGLNFGLVGSTYFGA